MRLDSNIWKYPIAGAPADNVRSGLPVTRQTGHVLTPSAGPGDREVVFLSDSGGHANLWVSNAETGELRQITNERDPNVAVGVPVWSPDGRSIAFVYSKGNPGLTFGVWLVDPDGSNLRSVANPGLGPAWSPDGRWLYYSTRGGVEHRIVMKKVPAEGGTPVTVTNGEAAQCDRLRRFDRVLPRSSGRSSTAAPSSKSGRRSRRMRRSRCSRAFQLRAFRSGRS